MHAQATLSFRYFIWNYDEFTNFSILGYSIVLYMEYFFFVYFQDFTYVCSVNNRNFTPASYVALV